MCHFEFFWKQKLDQSCIVLYCIAFLHKRYMGEEEDSYERKGGGNRIGREGLSMIQI